MSNRVRKVMRKEPEHRHKLLGAPYQVPRTRVGRTVKCLFHGRVKVCGWSDGRIPWPRVRVGHGGKGAYAMTAELARAIRTEAEANIGYWWGASTTTVCLWRRRLGVKSFNKGTQALYSAWQPIKIPDRALPISADALRHWRTKRRLTWSAVASKMGWHCLNTYGQYELRQRQRAWPETVARLARVFRCNVKDLVRK